MHLFSNKAIHQSCAVLLEAGLKQWVGTQEIWYQLPALLQAPLIWSKSLALFVPWSFPLEVELIVNSFLPLALSAWITGINSSMNVTNHECHGSLISFVAYSCELPYSRALSSFG